MTDGLDMVISIINYKTPELTIACVESVLMDLARSNNLTAHIVVTDNDSGDNSIQKLTDWVTDHRHTDQVSILASDVNSGFAGGHNRGIARLDAAYYLVLNSDAQVQPGCLGALWHAATARPDAGLVSPVITNQDGTPHSSHFRFHSPASEFIRGACSGPITRLLHRHEVAPQVPLTVQQADWVSFACVLLSRAMIRDIGPMDEGFFLYFEDAEYCLRAKRAGWTMAHTPQAVAMHIGGGSGPVVALAKAHARLPAYYYSARTRFFFLAYGRGGLWRANFCWALGRAVARLRWLAGRRPYPAASQEAIDIWRNIWSPLGPRFAPWESK